MTLEEVKRLLNDKAQTIKFEDLDSSHAGKLDIEHKSHDKTITINSFIHKTGTDKIFIFLSAVGIYREDVVFHRVYWANIFKGICVYIDDPCRHEIKWSPTYFFGTKRDDYTKRIFDLIKRIQNLYSIKNEHVCIISSSNGGFAAIRLSSLLPSSTCLALCPVLSIPTRKELVNSFQNKLSIDIRDPDVSNRIDLITSNVIKNSQSNIYIYSNVASSIDNLQMKCLYHSFGHDYNPSSNRIDIFNEGKLIVHMVTISGESPHTIQPGMHVCKVIYDLIDDNAPTKTIKAVCKSLGWIVADDYKQKAQIQDLNTRLEAFNADSLQRNI